MSTHDLSSNRQTDDVQRTLAPGGAEPANDDAPEPPERFGRFNPLRYASERVAAWRELRSAKKAGRQELTRYQRLRAARPELTGRALYEAFVRERNTLGASAAQALLQRAEASFAAWPADHDLIFRNVVQYLVISEYLMSHPERHSTATNMARIIADVIPRQF
jgi:hypothetical protein